MSNQNELSNPIAIRLPRDLLQQIEEIAGLCDRSRSWVMVRALKSYLANEGREILDVAKARGEIEQGDALDFDDVINDLDKTAKGAAA